LGVNGCLDWPNYNGKHPGVRLQLISAALALLAGGSSPPPHFLFDWLAVFLGTSRFLY